MNKSRLLLILVASNVLLAFGSVGAEAFFGWTLPPVLAEYRHARFSNFSIANPADGLRFLGIAITSLLAFAAWIGLARFWRHGRALYLVSWATWILFVLVSGAQVRTSVGAVFGALEALVAGVIVGLVYFSDLAHRFERAPVATAGAGLGPKRSLETISRT
jgi:hypothetical protein